MSQRHIHAACNKRSFHFKFVSGLLVGYFICSIMQSIITPCLISISSQAVSTIKEKAVWLKMRNESEIFGSGQRHASELITDSNLIIIGVMTAKNFLGTRAKTAFDTWVKSVPGKVIFFSSEGSAGLAPQGLPVVDLVGVDDSYPPQKKSFMMLKYIHDNYINDFRFFMRADDDVYVKGDKLARLLNTINSSQALFIGQAGLGNKEELGTLHLKTMENFCMGGPGMILTKSTLQRLVPHIGYCLSHLYTTHEDVEVGRCISRFAKVSCTWAYEMQKILYNNYNEPKGSFSHSLKDSDIHNAASLHPVKNPAYQYRLDQYFMSRHIMILRDQLSRLQREVNWVTDVLKDRDEFYSPNRYGMPPSLMKTVPHRRNEVLLWDFLTKSVFSARNINPRRSYDEDLKVALDDVIMQVMEIINENARQRGRIIEYREMLYGYHRVNPLHGADFILDLLLFYKKFKGKRKMTVPVRRHAYVQQAFLNVEFIEDDEFNSFPVVHLPVLPSGAATVSATGFIHDIRKRIGLVDSVSKVVEIRADRSLKTVNFILPLSGRFKTFLQFMHNFEDSCLIRNENVSLTIISFRSDQQDDRTDDAIAYVTALKQKYRRHRLTITEMSGSFSRGVALQRGSELYKDDDLLFFIDVDMYLHADTLHRIRLNTVLGRQVYYPIVFSQYDPQLACEKGNSSCPLRTSPFQFDSQFGYWRQFGYGITAMYKSDFKHVGGFDLEIKGWGKEDIDLIHKFIDFNITVFRSVDVGLVHMFHTIVCDPSLDSAQYQMCLGSKAASYASTEKLANIVYKTPEIFHRNETPDKVVAVVPDNHDQS